MKKFKNLNNQSINIFYIKYNKKIQEQDNEY